MTIFSIVLIIVPFILFGMIYSMKKKALLVIIPIIFIATTVGILFKELNKDHRQSFDYTRVTLSSNNYEQLTIKDNVLIDSNTFEPVLYQSSTHKTTNPSHRPIFIYTTESYYFIIYTTNPNESVDNNLFILYDYEFNKEDHNVMVILSKSTGRISTFHQYEYIGKTIDLSRIQSTEMMLYLPVMKDYTLDISYYAALFVVEEDSFLTFDTLGFSTPMDQEIIQFSVFKDYSIGLLSNGEVGFYRYSYEIDYQNIDGNLVVDGMSYGSDDIKILNDETFVSLGYFHVKNDILYYIDNTQHLASFDQGIITIIKQVQDIESWMDEIPN